MFQSSMATKYLISFIFVTWTLLKTESNYQTNCPRYAYIGGPHAGFGHMMSRIALGYVYAMEKSASLTVRMKDFVEGGKHGTYHWISEVFDISTLIDVNVLWQTKNLTIIKEPIWHQHNGNISDCNVLFHSCDSCCSSFNVTSADSKQWCYSNKQDIFSIVRPLMIKLYRTDAHMDIAQLEKARNRGFIDIVWHVRIGDMNLTLNTQPYFVKTLMNNMFSIFGNEKKFQIFVLSEGDLENNALCKFSFQSYNPVYLSSLNAREAFLYMVEASVLVTSGSSFSATATLFKSKTKISFQVTPRRGIYDVYDHALVSDLGNIIYPQNQTILRDRAQIILRNVADSTKV